MPDTTKAPPNVRLWEDNREVLAPLAALGLNCSEVVNEALRENLQKYAEKRLKKLKAALAEV
jgi:hypothetical protein